MVRKILVAIDETTASARALTFAAELARGLDARLVLVYVAPDAVLHHAGVEGADSLPFLRDMGRYLEELGRQYPSLCVSSVITHGPAAGVIVAYAAELAVDLIVAGTHARRGVERLLRGSVAEEVTRNASGPGLVVPEQNRQPVLATAMAACGREQP